MDRTGLDLCQTGPDSETVPQTGANMKNKPRHSGLHDPIWTGPETQNPQTGLTMHSGRGYQSEPKPV